MQQSTQTNTSFRKWSPMTNKADSNLTFSGYKPETVTKFTVMYAEKREFLEHLQKFGNDFERGAASLVIEVATAANGGVAV